MNWDVNRKIPYITIAPVTFAASAALNSRLRNSATSMSGSSSRAWRARKTRPTRQRRRRWRAATTSPRPRSATSLTPQITARIATSDSAALGRSSRPASGARNSGSSRGPRTSSAAITGTLAMNTQPHGRNSSSVPPTIGPRPAPPAKRGHHHAERGGALLLVREQHGHERHRRRRERRAREPLHGAGGDEHLGARRQGREHRGGAERAGAGEQHLAPPDPVAERAHGDQGAGDEEAVDVGDPQQLSAAGIQVGRQGRNGQEQDREVHRDEHARQREDGERDPLAAAGDGGGEGGGAGGLHASRDSAAARNSSAPDRRATAPTMASATAVSAAQAAKTPP